LSKLTNREVFERQEATQHQRSGPRARSKSHCHAKRWQHNHQHALLRDHRRGHGPGHVDDLSPIFHSTKGSKTREWNLRKYIYIREEGQLSDRKMSTDGSQEDSPRLQKTDVTKPSLRPHNKDIRALGHLAAQRIDCKHHLHWYVSDSVRLKPSTKRRQRGIGAEIYSARLASTTASTATGAAFLASAARHDMQKVRCEESRVEVWKIDMV